MTCSSSFCCCSFDCKTFECCTFFINFRRFAGGCSTFDSSSDSISLELNLESSSTVGDRVSFVLSASSLFSFAFNPAKNRATRDAPRLDA